MGKFKKGDKVICVDNPKGRRTFDDNSQGYGWGKWVIFTISSITGTSEHPIYWGKDSVDGNGVFEDYLEIYSCVPNELFEM